jgi:hypothetical protein
MRAWRRSVAVVAATVVLLGLSSPSLSANNLADVVWTDMRKLAPAGSIALGRANTVIEVQDTCDMLDSGISAANLLNATMAIAEKSGRNLKQKREMMQYGMSIMVVAGKRVCPRHMPAIWRAINA